MASDFLNTIMGSIKSGANKLKTRAGDLMDDFTNPSEPTAPVEEEGAEKKGGMSELAAMLGASAGPSFAQSAGSITPQFGRIGDGGGAASGLGPVVQPGGDPMGGLGTMFEGDRGKDFRSLLAKWKKPKAPLLPGQDPSIGLGNYPGA
jgi:hypothetical protein